MVNRAKFLKNLLYPTLLSYWGCWSRQATQQLVDRDIKRQVGFSRDFLRAAYGVSFYYCFALQIQPGRGNLISLSHRLSRWSAGLEILPPGRMQVLTRYWWWETSMAGWVWSERNCFHTPSQLPQAINFPVLVTQFQKFYDPLSASKSWPA